VSSEEDEALLSVRVAYRLSPVKSREAPRRAMIAGRTGSRALGTVNRAYESIKAIRSMTDQH